MVVIINTVKTDSFAIFCSKNDTSILGLILYLYFRILDFAFFASAKFEKCETDAHLKKSRKWFSKSVNDYSKEQDGYLKKGNGNLKARNGYLK